MLKYNYNPNSVLWFSVSMFAKVQKSGNLNRQSNHCNNFIQLERFVQKGNPIISPTKLAVYSYNDAVVIWNKTIL